MVELPSCRPWDLTWLTFVLEAAGPPLLFSIIYTTRWIHFASKTQWFQNTFISWCVPWHSTCSWAVGPVFGSPLFRQLLVTCLSTIIYTISTLLLHLFNYQLLLPSSYSLLLPNYSAALCCLNQPNSSPIRERVLCAGTLAVAPINSRQGACPIYHDVTARDVTTAVVITQTHSDSIYHTVHTRF